MTKTQKIITSYICDQCGDEGNSAETMIGIDRIGILDSNGFFEDDTFGSLHFCDRTCLEKWIEGRFE